MRKKIEESSYLDAMENTMLEYLMYMSTKGMKQTGEMIAVKLKDAIDKYLDSLYTPYEGEAKDQKAQEILSSLIKNLQRKF